MIAANPNRAMRAKLTNPNRRNHTMLHGWAASHDPSSTITFHSMSR